MCFVMSHSRNKEKLKTYIQMHKEEIRKLSLETRKFLAILLDQYEVMEFGFSKQAAQDKMQQRFNLTKKAAAEYMKKYYTNNRQTK